MNSYDGPVRFRSVECADENWKPVPENQQLCDQADIEGYPTMKLYKNGHEVATYEGDRTPQSMVDFVRGHESAAEQAMPPMLALIPPPPSAAAARKRSADFL